MIRDKLTNQQVVSLIKRCAIIGLIMLLIFGFVRNEGFAEMLAGNGDLLRTRISKFGAFGPLIIIVMMTVAVVMSPLPSAPIALVAGAMYGHLWGTLYVELGAMFGALIAFSIARYLRPEQASQWLDNMLCFKRYSSQYTLMVAVCISRLLPFVSFDLVSYAAGLTPLAVWRFLLATMIGVLPASFVLAHMGSELSTFDSERIALALAVLILLGMAPLIVGQLRKRKKTINPDRCSPTM